MFLSLSFVAVSYHCCIQFASQSWGMRRQSVCTSKSGSRRNVEAPRQMPPCKAAWWPGPLACPTISVWAHTYFQTATAFTTLHWANISWSSHRLLSANTLQGLDSWLRVGLHRNGTRLNAWRGRDVEGEDVWWIWGRRRPAIKGGSTWLPLLLYSVLWSIQSLRPFCGPRF